MIDTDMFNDQRVNRKGKFFSTKLQKFTQGNNVCAKRKFKKHTTIGIRWWSPTQLLIDRSTAYVWQSGRDAQLFVVCGRMCKDRSLFRIYCVFLSLALGFGDGGIAEGLRTLRVHIGTFGLFFVIIGRTRYCCFQSSLATPSMVKKNGSESDAVAFKAIQIRINEGSKSIREDASICKCLLAFFWLIPLIASSYENTTDGVHSDAICVIFDQESLSKYFLINDFLTAHLHH